MKITMFEKSADESLGDGPELWVQVLSLQVEPLAAIKEAMTPEQGAILAGYASKPSAFFPHWVSPEERAEHGYRFDDIWAFSKIGA